MGDLKATRKQESEACNWELENHFDHKKKARTIRGNQTILPGCCWHHFDWAMGL